jgi:hypothetical protein
MALVLAGAREKIVQLVRSIFSLPAAALGVVHTASEDLLAKSRQTQATITSSLAVKGEALGPTDVVQPLVSAALLVLMILGEWVVSSLRMSALFHPGADTVTVGASTLDQLSGATYVAAVLVLGAAALETSGVTPRTRTFARIRAPFERPVATLAWLSVLVGISGGVLFFVWGQAQIHGGGNRIVEYVFVGIYAYLVLTAAMVALAQAMYAPLAVLYLVYYPVVALARLTNYVSGLARSSHKVEDVVVNVVDLAAWPGSAVWRWINRFDVARRAHFEDTPDSPVNEASESPTAYGPIRAVEFGTTEPTTTPDPAADDDDDNAA